MKEFIDKLIARVEELKNNRFKVGNCDNYDCNDADDDCTTCYIQRIMSIVNQLAEEYNNESVKGDLISRSAVIELIESKCVDGCLEQDDITLIDAYGLMDDVSDLPTAYNNGWIPCSERLPQTNDAVNITWINRKPEPYYEDIKDKPFTTTGHYHNGKWYWFSSVCKDYLDEYGDSEFDRIDKDIEIVAWCELPAPYTEGE